MGALRGARQSRELLTVLATTDAHRTPHPDDGAAPVSAVVRRLVAAARTTTGLQTAALTHVRGTSQTSTVVDTAPGAEEGADAG